MFASLLNSIWKFISIVIIRVSRTRFTVAFFSFTVVICFAQSLILSLLFSLNAHNYDIVHGIIRQADVPQRNFAVPYYDSPTSENFHLDICNSVPRNTIQRDSAPCSTVFSTDRRNNLTDGAVHMLLPNFDYPDGFNVVVEGHTRPVPLSGECILTLLYPMQLLQDLFRENLVLLCTQFWMLSISVLGVLHESISHIIAVLCIRFLMAMWSSYSLARTHFDLAAFTDLIDGPNSPCDSRVALYRTYIHNRRTMEIADLIFHIISIFVSGFLTRKVVRTYDERGFNRVGAPARIRQIYRLFLAGLASFQLSVVFLAAALSMWLYQLTNSPLAMFSKHKPVYLVLAGFTLAVMFPWATLGWYSIRRERKRLVIAFLSVAGLLVICWFLMFLSWHYRWTFVHWPFFAIMSILATLGMVTSISIAVLCWWNFDKGLAHYLYVDGLLSKLNFTPDTFDHDVEKVHVEKMATDCGPPIFVDINNRSVFDPDTAKTSAGLSNGGLDKLPQRGAFALWK